MQEKMGKSLKQTATAGFEEKNDILITVSPLNAGENTVDLTSTVLHQYGRQIKKLIIDTVNDAGFKSVKINAIDKGAWDYTIKARVLGALERGMKA
ncbi:MAG: citrate lyase acyl carrier protein [Selenomonadaceae bacterium]